jgi:hypothetical protein
MMKTMRTGFVVFGLALAYTSQASAQAAGAPKMERLVFLDLNAAFEASPKSLETSSTFPLFGETGAAATRQQPGASALADARLGYRVSPQFGVAFGFAGGRSEAIGKTAASVPSPIRFASPSLVTLDAPGLKRREAGYHIQAVWFLPISGSGDTTVALSGGPSLIRLQQGVPRVAVDAAAQASTSVTNETATAKGVHVGVDLARAFSDRLGVGVFVRYVAASADLPSAADVKVGGVQAGGGLRIRF